MPFLYMYKALTDSIGYVLMEPDTRVLIAIDIWDYYRSYKVISELERKHRT